MELLDNYLPYDLFNDLQSKIMGPHFPWYYNEYTLSPRGDHFNEDKNTFQFTHSLFKSNRGVTGEWFNIAVPILQKLVGSNLIIKVKANCNPRDSKNTMLGNFHIDTEFDNAKTAIFYFNTNDGYTEFETGEKVQSKANRLVIFDANTKHVGFTCTDAKTRVLLNINYLLSK
jgi:hypothetical protein